MERCNFTLYLDLDSDDFIEEIVDQIYEEIEERVILMGVDCGRPFVDMFGWSEDLEKEAKKAIETIERLGIKVTSYERF